MAIGNSIASKVDAVVLKGRCRRLQDAPMSFRFKIDATRGERIFKK